MSFYKAEQFSGDNYLVLGLNEEPILNHLAKPFGFVTESIADHLVNDLNAIHQKNLNDKKKGLSPADHARPDVQAGELKESLMYCVLSTLQQAPDEVYELEIEQAIQWDRVFRLNPGPPNLLFEIKHIAPIKNYLGKLYVDLPLNYSDSVEEMQEDGTELVPQTVIDKLYELTNAMEPKRRFMVMLLYNFFDNFSIAAPILWVAGKINDAEMVNAFWAFVNGEDPDDAEGEAAEAIKFLKNRLLFLSTLK